MLFQTGSKARTRFGDSEPVKISVDIPQGKDAAALQMVIKQKAFLWFHENTAESRAGMHDSSTIIREADQLQSFIKLHPETRYCRWVELGVIWLERHILYKSISNHTATNSAAELELLYKRLTHISQIVPDDMRTHCWYAAGEISFKAGNYKNALDNYERLLKSPSQTIACHKMQLLGLYEKTKAMLHKEDGAKTDANPKYILKQSIAQLEAERYDVLGWERSILPARQEYAGKTLEVYELMWRGHISEEEGCRRLAHLLTNYVRQYWRPVSVEEWKKLQAKYEAERRMNQAAEEADRKRLVKELEQQKRQ